MAKSKQKVKQAAKQSASTGSLTNKQINQLKDAGVKSSAISNIKTTNSQAKTSNPNPSAPAQQPQNNNTNKTPNAITDGRYGLGAQKAAAQNYQGLVEKGNTDAFNPGKPGSRMNIMADGFVGKKELNKFANLKDIDASQARKRLSSKGAAFTAAANKRADRVFGKNNPFLSMMIGSGSGDEGLISAAQSPGKARQMQITKDSRAFDYKNRLPDEVFRFRPESGMQGDRPMPNMERLNQIFGNPIVGDKPPGGDPPPGDNPPPTTVNPVEVLPEEVLPEEQPLDPGQGMMAGGGLGAAGAAKLGRARSRLQRLGILGRGTGLFGRGLQYGNSLNA
jgi:hypothetical protein